MSVAVAEGRRGEERISVGVGASDRRAQLTDEGQRCVVQPNCRTLSILVKAYVDRGDMARAFMVRGPKTAGVML